MHKSIRHNIWSELATEEKCREYMNWHDTLMPDLPGLVYAEVVLIDENQFFILARIIHERADRSVRSSQSGCPG
jgi:hypothetical protein